MKWLCIKSQQAYGPGPDFLKSKAHACAAHTVSAPTPPQPAAAPARLPAAVRAASNSLDELPPLSPSISSQQLGPGRERHAPSLPSGQCQICLALSNLVVALVEPGTPRMHAAISCRSGRLECCACQLPPSSHPPMFSDPSAGMRDPTSLLKLIPFDSAPLLLTRLFLVWAQRAWF